MATKISNYFPIIIIPILLFALFFFKHERPKHLILPQVPAAEPAAQEVIDLIYRINNKNKTIRTFSCDKVNITINDHSLISLTGIIRFEKERLFRMVTDSSFGRETDVGSNANQFWFWSKRMNPPYLYYADYKDLEKTRLKTAFHPVWMMESLGFNEIPNGEYQVIKQGNYFKLSIISKSVQGKSIIKTIVIDADKLAIVGNYIFDKKGLVISSEIYETVEKNGYNLPSKISIHLIEENVVLDWNLNNPEVNYMIDNSAWQMPNKSKSIDMGKE